MKSFSFRGAFIFVVAGLVVVAASRIIANRETQILCAVVGAIVVLIGVFRGIYSLGGRSDEE